MKMRIAFCSLVFLLLLSGCEVFRPDQEFSTVPATNNPHIIVDSNRGVRGL